MEWSDTGSGKSSGARVWPGSTMVMVSAATITVQLIADAHCPASRGMRGESQLLATPQASGIIAAMLKVMHEPPRVAVTRQAGIPVGTDRSLT